MRDLPYMKVRHARMVFSARTQTSVLSPWCADSLAAYFKLTRRVVMRGTTGDLCTVHRFAPITAPAPYIYYVILLTDIRHLHPLS